jgi:hypothetical protein
MLKIITISNDNDDAINRVRSRIPSWARQHGWIYTGYNNSEDNIARIRGVANGTQIEVIDCVCHGTPTLFNGTTLTKALTWGQKLSQVPGVTSHTSVYLDACNTGLTWEQFGPIAQEVANGAGCRVFGTKGYAEGTYAEQNEVCEASPVVIPPYRVTPYPGAHDARGRNVWIEFRSRAITHEKIMSEQISFDVSRGKEDAGELVLAIEAILDTKTIEFPKLRIAPDLTLNYERDDRIRVLDIYANGGLVKDRIHNDAWAVPDPERFQAVLRRFLKTKM